MLDRPGLLPEESYRETTEAWLAAFDAALSRRSAAELSQLFVADSHWRNLFGISWHFATFSGQRTVVSELLARSAEVGAGRFRIDVGRLAPRAAVVAGRDVVEAIFAFETVNGPGYGAVRLLREADGAVARLDDLDLARFRCRLRRARGRRRDLPRQRFRRPRLARAAAGLRDV